MNNIEILNSYVDKEGKDIVVLSFDSGKYLCSYSDGTKASLSKEDIFERKVEVKIVEPEYFEGQMFDFSEDTSSLGDILFDPPDEEVETIEEKIDPPEEKPDPVEEEEEDDFFKHFL